MIRGRPAANREETMNSTKIAALAALLACNGGTAFAQNQRQPAQLPNPFQGLFSGTPQEQAACHPDAAKHCQTAGTDEFRVLACLQQNRAQISVACRRVLESHGQ
jgi:hypothetical protein